MDNQFTQDWSKFFNEAEEEAKKAEQEAAEEQGMDDSSFSPATEDRFYALSTDQVRTLCRRISGRKANGEKASVAGYLSYLDRKGVDVLNTLEPPTPLKDGVVTVLPSAQLPDFYTVDVEFSDPKSEEIKKFWATYEKYRHDELVAKPTETPVFYINLEENLSEQEFNAAGEIIICGIANPILGYITRTSPTMNAEDSVSMDGDIIGGNVIRLLVHTDMLTFRMISKEEAPFLNPDLYSYGKPFVAPPEPQKEEPKDPEQQAIEEDETFKSLLSVPPGYYDMDND